MPDYRQTSPSDMLAKTQRRIIFFIHFWTLVFVTPFTLHQLVMAHWLLGAALVILCANNALVLYFLHYHDKYLLKGAGFVFLACLGVSASSVINGIMGLFWAYPVVIGIFFLMPLRTALYWNSLFITIEFAIAAQHLSPQLELRFIATLILASAFSYVISLLVDRQHRTLLKLATTDALTQCLNRMALTPALIRAEQLHSRYQQTFSLAIIDLDHFKKVNDTLGHGAGDTILKEFAKLLQTRLRTTDSLFRYGGEEFVLLLPNTAGNDAVRLAEELRIAIEGYAFSHNLNLTASFGVAQLQTNENHDQWLDRADACLYDAKSQGRNRVITS
ncbi:MAG: GGDEF domain-containing protein [Hahellaceae bacterium]|nr:GGDEF domain-containing protein [Hahellaceae bacterium]